MNKYDHKELTLLASELLMKAGLDQDRAEITASTLVEGDLMGHFTHGLALLGPYLQNMEKGGMKLSGEPMVINDTGSTLTWDGQYLPGCWLVHQAIDTAIERIKEHPVMTVAISKSHHIGCLAAYPKRATDQNLMMILSCSDPKNATVAPFGGLTGMYSPNPIAYGIPTETDPIILDISMSSTANGLIYQSKAQGKKLPHQWLMDSEGKPTDDPAEFFEDPPATILPLGGMDTGYKGFGLGLVAEILTSGLSGHGRADQPDDWGASVFLQIIDPGAFGGIDNFKRQAQYLVDTFQKSQPIDPNHPVRIPGSRALMLRKKRMTEGVELDQTVIKSLKEWAEKLEVTFPL